MADGEGGLGGREVVIVKVALTPAGRGHPEEGLVSLAIKGEGSNPFGPVAEIQLPSEVRSS